VWNFDDAEFIYQTLANTLPGAVALGFSGWFHGFVDTCVFSLILLKNCSWQEGFTLMELIFLGESND